MTLLEALQRLFRNRGDDAAEAAPGAALPHVIIPPAAAKGAGSFAPLVGALTLDAVRAGLLQRDVDRLAGIHPDLRRVVLRAASNGARFAVLEGVRSRARQEQLVAKGASQTMNSRHLTGHAVDLAPTVAGEIRWDWPLYDRLADQVKAAARDEGVAIEWGGDWQRFRDGPHWQLPWPGG